MHLKRPPNRDAQWRITRVRSALQASLQRCAWECGSLNVIGAKVEESAPSVADAGTLVALSISPATDSGRYRPNPKW